MLRRCWRSLVLHQGHFALLRLSRVRPLSTLPNSPLLGQPNHQPPDNDLDYQTLMRAIDTRQPPDSLHSLTIPLIMSLSDPTRAYRKVAILRALNSMAGTLIRRKIPLLAHSTALLLVHSPHPLGYPEVVPLLSAYLRLSLRDRAAYSYAALLPSSHHDDLFRLLDEKISAGDPSEILNTYIACVNLKHYLPNDNHAGMALQPAIPDDLYARLATHFLSLPGPAGQAHLADLLFAYRRSTDLIGVGSIYSAVIASRSAWQAASISAASSQPPLPPPPTPYYLSSNMRDIIIATYIQRKEIDIATTIMENWTETGPASTPPTRKQLVKLLTALVHDEKHPRALALLHYVATLGLPIDEGLYRIFLQAHVDAGDPEGARAIIAEIRQTFSRDPEPASFALLSRAYASAGDIETAEAIVLRHLNAPSLDVYISLFRAKILAQDVDGAQRILGTIAKRRLVLDDENFATILDVYASSTNPRAAIKLYKLLSIVPSRRSPRYGVHVSTRSIAVVLRAYAREANLDGVLAILKDMAALGLPPSDDVERTLVVIFARRKDPESAEAILGEISTSLIPTARTYAPLIAAYAAADRIADAEAVFARMVAQGLQPTPAAFNALIGHRARLSDLEGALAIYAQMPAHACPPNAHTYSLIIHALAAAGQTDDAAAVYDSARASLAPAGAGPYNHLILAYLKEGRDADARRIYSEMITAGIAPDGVTYTILMGAYARVYDPEGATSTFREMRSKNFSPDVVHYTVLLSAYGRAGDLEGVDSVLAEWVGLNEGDIASVDMIMWAALVKTRKERFWEAHGIWVEAKRAGLASDRAYAIIVNAAGRMAVRSRAYDIEERYREKRARVQRARNLRYRGQIPDPEDDKEPPEEVLDMQRDRELERERERVRQGYGGGQDPAEVVLEEWQEGMRGVWKPSPRNAAQLAATLLHSGRPQEAMEPLRYLREEREKLGLPEEDPIWGIPWWVAVAASDLLRYERGTYGVDALQEAILYLEAESPDLLRRIERGNDG